MYGPDKEDSLSNSSSLDEETRKMKAEMAAGSVAAEEKIAKENEGKPNPNDAITVEQKVEKLKKGLEKMAYKEPEEEKKAADTSEKPEKSKVQGEPAAPKPSERKAKQATATPENTPVAKEEPVKDAAKTAQEDAQTKEYRIYYGAVKSDYLSGHNEAKYNTLNARFESFDSVNEHPVGSKEFVTALVAKFSGIRWDKAYSNEPEKEEVKEPIKHIVAYKERIPQIAKKYGVSEKALMEANSDLLGVTGRIYWFKEGEEIIIPEPTPVTSEPEVEKALEESIKEALESPAKTEVKAEDSPVIVESEVKPEEVAPVEVNMPTTTEPAAQPTNQTEPVKEPETQVTEPTQEEPKEISILAATPTTGASAKTASSDKLEVTGVEASNKMAKTDLERVKQYKTLFTTAGKKYGIPPALLAAISSRESRVGKAIDADGSAHHDENGYGLMQIDSKASNVVSKGGPKSQEHVNQAAEMLSGFRKKVKAKHPSWSEALQLKGAVAAYNFGVDDVQTIAGLDKGSTNDDYSSDIWARALFYEGEGIFDDGKVMVDAKGETVSSTEAAKVAEPEKAKEPIAEKVETTVTDSVGKGGVNLKEDVVLIQDKLLALGLLTESAYSQENQATIQAATPSVEESKIEQTIAAIEKFQKEVLYWNNYDGNIGGPTSSTLEKLNSEGIDKDYVQKRIAGYPAMQAQRVAAAEKKKKEEEAKKQQAAIRAEQKRKEDERIKALKNESLEAENIEKNFIDKYEDLELAVVLKGYVIHNPELVVKVLDTKDSDELGVEFLKLFTDEELKQLDQTVLKSLISSLEHWYDNALFDENKTEKDRVRRFVLNDKEGTEKESEKASEPESANTASANNSASNQLADFSLSGSVGTGQDNKVDDVILVQNLLVNFEYMTSDNSELNTVQQAKAAGTQVISDDQMPQTIEAIKQYQKYGSTVSYSSTSQKSVWQGDGEISKNGGTAASMKSMTKIHNDYAGHQFVESTLNVLDDSQWVTQFRFGGNFYSGDTEVAYVDYVKDKTGFDDANQLHEASEEIIKDVKSKYKDLGKWFESADLKEGNSLSTADKAYPSKGNRVCCFDAAKKMLGFTGASPQDKTTKIQTFLEESGSGGEFTKQAKLGVKYIDAQLEDGKAVFVAVDKAQEGSVQRNEGTSDHFIVIMGKGKDDKGWYFRYFEPGTIQKSNKGVNTGNKLYIDSGEVKNDKYNLSQIRVNND